MIILGIETSCDETACAIVKKDRDRVKILSNVVSSSANLQAKYGGVIPEQAAREQIKSIVPVIEEALNQAFSDVIPANAGIHLNTFCSELDPRLRGDDKKDSGDDVIRKIDALAVTSGPGLIGSLLVGVETAKTLATIWNKPLIPVNHLLGHFYANWVDYGSSPLRSNKNSSSTKRSAWRSTTTPTFPCLGLLVSGGHTDLLLFTDHGKYKYLGGTRDDAAGECFDKCARLLGLSYPGGPAIAKLASQGDALKFDLPRPMIDSKDFDFSFSGLKTAVANLLQGHSLLASRRSGSTQGVTLRNLAASVEQAIVDVLVEKTIRAAQKYNVDQIMIAGGVAANQKLTSDLQLKIENLKLKIKLHVPPANLCTDNAAMIATAALFNPQTIDPLNLQANPSLTL